MRRLYLLFALATFVLVAALPFAAQAQVPAKISYQGLVLDEAQALLADGTYQVTFRLYSEDGGAPALWSETQTVAVEGGLLSTLIGAGEALDLPFDEPYYLTVQLEGQPESQRVPLSTSAYAFLARDVPDGTVVRSISGMQDDVEIVGGEGIAVEQQDNRLVISAEGSRPLPGFGPGERGTITPIQKLYPATEEEDEKVLESVMKTLGAGGSNTGLDAAYDNGRIITLDDGRVVYQGLSGSIGLEFNDSDMLFRSTNGDNPKMRFRVDTAVPLQVYRIEIDAASGIWNFANSTGGTVPLQMTKTAADNLVKLDGSSLVLQNTSGTAKITLNTDESGDGRVTTQELAITGGSDLSEGFDVSGAHGIAEPLPGMVVSIDPAHPGKLAVSGTPYDRMVAGVVSGAGGIETGLIMGQEGSVADGEVPVALTGRVYVYVDAASGAIAPGDLLTTSATPGHAMKVTDHARAQGAILGKAMTALPEGRGLVLMLVSLQ